MEEEKTNLNIAVTPLEKKRWDILKVEVQNPLKPNKTLRASELLVFLMNYYEKNEKEKNDIQYNCFLKKKDLP